MPTLTSYTKSTEENILNNPPSADGEMAFSTDTKKLFISQGTEWSYWSADKTLGNYYLGPDPVPRPFHHFDPTVSTSMVDSNGLPVSNGGSVAAIKDLAGGAKIESDTALQQPTLISAELRLALHHMRFLVEMQELMDCLFGDLMVHNI